MWALGVKEVWKVAKPLDRVIHTMGWPLRAAAKYREFGGSFIYPMGEDMVTVGMVVGLDYRDAELSVHDLLQELKTHPLVRKLLNGGERVAWGAKTIPEGGFLSLPKQLHAPGVLICGDGAGLVNVPALKGIHYAIESGSLAAEAAFAALQRGQTPWTPGASSVYDEALRQSFVWKDLQEVRNMRQAFGRGFLARRRAGGDDDCDEGTLPAGQLEHGAGCRAGADPYGSRAELSGAGRKAHVRQAVVGLRVGQQDAGRPAEPHRPAPRRSARARADVGAHVPRAGVRGDGRGVEVTPSNCVQCGAITAKGGRLTPPEGGSGPEYTVT